jgi:hypothetical protein
MNNNQKVFIAMGLMVALAFVVVGASSLVTPVTAAGKPSGAGPHAGTFASQCAQGADPGHMSCRPVIPNPGPP